MPSSPNANPSQLVESIWSLWMSWVLRGNLRELVGNVEQGFKRSRRGLRDGVYRQSPVTEPDG
jgi:hypothetical protein